MVQLTKEVNDRRNLNMKGKGPNRQDDTACERHINKEIRGESVESPTFGDKYKVDIGLKFAQEMAADCSPLTQSIWNNVVSQLQNVRDKWNQ